MSISSFSRNAELTDQTRNLLRKPSFDNWYENILKLEILKSHPFPLCYSHLISHLVF